MLWFDWMTLGIIVVVTVTQVLRARSTGGYGLPLWDFIWRVVAALASTFAAGPIAGIFGAPIWIVTLVMFIVLGIGAFLLGRTIFGVTEWSSESFGGILAFVFGVGGGWVIANMVLRIIIVNQGDLGPVSEMMWAAPVAREVFRFQWWNWLMKTLFDLNLGPKINVDVG